MANPNNQVVAICQKQAKGLTGINRINYAPSRMPTKSMHHYLLGTESAILNGQATVRVMQ